MRSCCFTSLFIALFPFICLYALPAHASTFWATAGEKTANGGTMLAKNYDCTPEPSEIRLIVPKSGFTYLGIFPTRGIKTRGVVAGINEKGLALVSAFAHSVSKNTRYAVGKNINEKILTSCDSVDTLLKNRQILSKSYPSFYMIADRERIALIEVASRGEISINTVYNGILYHTDHYINEKLLWANKDIGTSSQARFNRIKYLLTSYPSSFTMADFIAFSEDVHDGPDNSIWRTGSTPKKERTLASWIVYMPKNGYPELYVRLANPDEPEKAYNMLLDTPFWVEGIE